MSLKSEKWAHFFNWISRSTESHYNASYVLQYVQTVFNAILKDIAFTQLNCTAKNRFLYHSKVEPLYKGHLDLKWGHCLPPQPQELCTNQLYLWIRDTSLYRTASWVSVVSTIERFHCMYDEFGESKYGKMKKRHDSFWSCSLYFSTLFM